MNFDHYTGCEVAMAAGLVNDDLSDVAALRAFLDHYEISNPGRLTSEILEDVRSLGPELRAIFEAADEADAADRINAMLALAAALPQLTDHDGEPWHVHVSPIGAPLAVRLAAESAMGLAAVMREGGTDRLRVCADDTCADVFVDTSRNRSRRYCNPDTCGNRANVAAYRARRRAKRAAVKSS